MRGPVKGMARCQSPLEIKLGRAFALIGVFEPRLDGDEYSIIGAWPFAGLVLHAQPQICGIHPDFALIPESGSWRVAIEVDGHAYHERTKEQADRDRKRDRDMLREDVVMLRFTGSEVWRGADDCAREALSVAVGMMAKEYARTAYREPAYA